MFVLKMKQRLKNNFVLYDVQVWFASKPADKVCWENGIFDCEAIQFCITKKNNFNNDMFKYYFGLYLCLFLYFKVSM